MNILRIRFDYVRYEQLRYGHVRIMYDERLATKWYLPIRREKGSLQNSWILEMTVGMRAENRAVCNGWSVNDEEEK